jgi:DNA-binding transcriptional regulator YhcF (GntR family)
MPFTIDPDLPVPLGNQLRGAIEYGIACGQLPPGWRLPTVRAMAGELGVAPMTVSRVYAELKAAGLLETKAGHGTFVSTSGLAQVRPEVVALQARIDALLAQAIAVGLTGADIVGLVNARVNRYGRAAKGLRVAYVGLFEEATEAYAADIRGRLPTGDTIQATTLSAISQPGLARRRALEADLVVAPAHRRADIHAILGEQKPVLGISHIPSEVTRTLLARIDPLAHVTIVSTFAEFLPVMKAGVRRFAPHVHDVQATVIDDPDLANALRQRDVVIFASGSTRAASLLAPATECFEYRHTPDPREIDQNLLPMLETLRHQLTVPPPALSAPAKRPRKS